jgi:hypothetical protein
MDFALVASWEAKPPTWHYVREQYRLDLAVSLCGINNGESWRVYVDGEYFGRACPVCLKAVQNARGVI